MFMSMLTHSLQLLSEIIKNNKNNKKYLSVPKKQQHRNYVERSSRAFRNSYIILDWVNPSPGRTSFNLWKKKLKIKEKLKLGKGKGGKKNEKQLNIIKDIPEVQTDQALPGIIYVVSTLRQGNWIESLQP